MQLVLKKKSVKELKRDLASPSATMPDDCLKAVQNVASAAGGLVLANEPSDYSVTAVRVTHVGPPPAPNEGPKMPLAYKASVVIGGDVQATVSVRIIRGGCIVTNYNE